MNTLPAAVVPFSFESHEVRVIERDGDPWFVLADACRVLGTSNVTDAAARLDDDEKGFDSIETPSGVQQMLIISEPGLYKLIGTSRKPAAKQFDRWVRHEVLPAIRRTGAYNVQGVGLQQIAEIIVDGMKQAIAPLGLRLESQDRAIDRIEKRQDAMAEDVASIKARLLGGRRRLSADTKREHVDAVNQFGGLCPCCRTAAVIVDGMKLKFSEYDHFYQNSRPDADHTWLVCLPCHAKFTNGKVPRDQREAEFRAYQNQRRRLPGRQIKMKFG